LYIIAKLAGLTMVEALQPGGSALPFEATAKFRNWHDPDAGAMFARLSVSGDKRTKPSRGAVQAH